MRVLDIPPHSPTASRLAVAALVLIAGFALTGGFLRQVVAAAPQARAVADGTDTIAEATPVPEPSLQTAEPPPRRVHLAAAVPVDVSDDVAPAEAVPAADASASASAAAPDAAPAPEQTGSGDPPSV